VNPLIESNPGVMRNVGPVGLWALRGARFQHEGANASGIQPPAAYRASAKRPGGRAPRE
jgi:hypothetical protein